MDKCFLKLEGFHGASQDLTHGGWIDVKAFSVNPRSTCYRVLRPEFGDYGKPVPLQICYEFDYGFTVPPDPVAAQLFRYPFSLHDTIVGLFEICDRTKPIFRLRMDGISQLDVRPRRGGFEFAIKARKSSFHTFPRPPLIWEPSLL